MAGPYYVKNGTAGSAAPYDTWAKAATTLLIAVDAASAGETIYIDKTHTETPVAHTSYVLPGTEASPTNIISVTASGTADTAYAKMTTTGVKPTGNFDLTFSGVGIITGLVATAGRNFNHASDAYMQYNDCTIGLSGAGTTQLNCDYSDATFYFRNTVFNFGAAAQGFLYGNGDAIYMENCSLSGTAINDLFRAAPSQRGANVEINGCDFSGLVATTGEIFFAMPSSTVSQHSKYVVSKTVLPSGGKVTTAAINAAGTRLEIYSTSPSDDDVPNMLDVRTLWGTALTDEANYLDTSNGFSILVTPDSASSVTQPHRFMLGEVYAAANATIRIEGLVDGTILKDNEIWMELCIPDVTNAQHGVWVTTLLGHDGKFSTTPPDITAAGTSHPASTDESWTNTTTTDTEFYDAIDLTGLNSAGVVQVWVCAAYASNEATYIDSKIVVT